MPLARFALFVFAKTLRFLFAETLLFGKANHVHDESDEPQGSRMAGAFLGTCETSRQQAHLGKHSPTVIILCKQSAWRRRRGRQEPPPTTPNPSMELLITSTAYNILNTANGACFGFGVARGCPAASTKAALLVSIAVAALYGLVYLRSRTSKSQEDRG